MGKMSLTTAVKKYSKHLKKLEKEREKQQKLKEKAAIYKDVVDVSSKPVYKTQKASGCIMPIMLLIFMLTFIILSGV